MIVLICALVALVAAAAVFGIRQYRRRNARLTCQIITLTETKQTRLFTPTDIAAELKISVKKAENLIAALPGDPGRYLLSEGGIRFWRATGDWHLELLHYITQDVLTYIVAYQHQTVTASAMAAALHNPVHLIEAVLQELRKSPSTAGIAYTVSLDCRTIKATGPAYMI